MADHCRSCGAPIQWAETRKGRRIPLDPDPAEDGNVVIVKEVRVGALYRNVADVLSAAALAALSPDRLRFKSHFATCPNARSHRRKTRP